MEYEDGAKAELVHNWQTAKDPRAKLDKPFVGKTVFKLASRSTKNVHTNSPLCRYQRLRRSLSLVHLWRNLQRRYSHRRNAPAQVQNTFRNHLHQAAGGTLEAYQTTILEQLRQVEPFTNQAYDHDLWFGLPLVWLRIHYIHGTLCLFQRTENS